MSIFSRRNSYVEDLAEKVKKDADNRGIEKDNIATPAKPFKAIKGEYPTKGIDDKRLR